MNDFEMNILVAGRTGCGKSAFVNYLYGAPVRRTGAGKPVTDRGVFCERFTLPNGIALNVHDTWGLEPDCAEDWEQLILDEVYQHDRGGAADWFHAVFYCLSVRTARVEEVEMSIINRLQEAGCRVWVVLTHGDAPGADAAAAEMRHILHARCGIAPGDALMVCSVDKVLLGGQSVHPFGRESVLARLTAGLWCSLREKYLFNLRRQGRDAIEHWYQLSDELIDRRINFLTLLDRSTSEQLGAEINRTAQGVTAEIQRLTGEGFSACLDAYQHLMSIYGREGLRVLSPAQTPQGMVFCCELDARQRGVYAFCTALIALIPFYNLTLPYKAAKMRRNEIKLLLMKHRLEMQEQLRLYLDEVETSLRALQIQEHYERADFQ